MTTTDSATLDLETYRRELTAYCYRMLGSNFEAEDAVQETMVRAWRGMDSFEGRSALRSWLYRIATNVCLDMIRGSQRRARPMDMGPSTTIEGVLATPVIADNAFVEPMHDDRIFALEADPAELTAHRESVKLAFVAALQHLPARQRAVLILREVLRWQASEVAELLETTVASVNSALQRARATLDSVHVDQDAAAATPDDPAKREILAKYVDCFERYDIDSLVELLSDEVRFCMPPYPMWLTGPLDVGNWMIGPGQGCRGSRLIPTSANGCPAFGSYRRSRPGVHEPWSIQVLEIADGRITGIHNFLDTTLFEKFGLPLRIES